MEKRDTPLKTNSSPLKNDGLEDYFSFSEWSLFRGHSFIFGVYLWRLDKKTTFRSAMKLRVAHLAQKDPSRS